MSRKISAETRRKLLEAARARWAKTTEKSTAKAKPAEPVKRPTPAVVTVLDISDLKSRAESGIIVQGLRYFLDKSRFKLLQEKDDIVSVRVRGSEDYEVSFDLEPAQRKIYNQTRDEYRAKILKLIEDKGVKDARFRILEGLLRLRQICNHPKLMQPAYKGNSAKLDTLLETVDTLRAENHKVLIFSQFVQMLKLIEAELTKAKIPYSYLDGSTVNRQARVDEFQTNEAIPVFLISLKAGGVGLNLTAADYVIHVDPWWNPAVEMQASDRAHRIGQNKPVFVYKLMMRDSVEEKILQLQERKRNLVKQLITTEAGFFKSLTADDIAALFS